MEELEKKAHNEDRISGLPDHIIYHILSFLPTKSITQTNLLSIRWKSLSLSSPNLDFSDIGCPSSMFPTKSITPPTSTSVLSKLLTYLTKPCPCRPRQTRSILSKEKIVANYQTKVITSIIIALSRRQESSNIKVFRIGSDKKRLHIGREHVSFQLLHKCITLAVKYQVEQLELNIRALDERFYLPACVYECDSLRSLTLKGWIGFLYLDNVNFLATMSLRLQRLHTLSLFGVNFPHRPELVMDLFSAASFPSLEKLTLTHYREIDNLKISCPSLQQLTLKHCGEIKNLKISCPSLKYVTLDSLYIEKSLQICGTRVETLEIESCYICVDNVATWVEIIAPNLQTFLWEDNPMSFTTDKFMIHSCPTLKTCRLGFSCPSNISNFFWSSSHVQQLCISRTTLEFLSKVYFQGGGLPCSFPELLTLEIVSYYVGKLEIPGLAYLLKSSPQLQTLNIKTRDLRKADTGWKNNGLDDRNCSEEQYWEDEAEWLSPSLCKLTSVNIDVCRISEGMISLIRFLLGHVGGLQEFRICYCLKEDFKDKISLIEGFPRASANVKIYFVRESQHKESFVWWYFSL